MIRTRQGKKEEKGGARRVIVSSYAIPIVIAHRNSKQQYVVCLVVALSKSMLLCRWMKNFIENNVYVIILSMNFTSRDAENGLQLRPIWTSFPSFFQLSLNGSYKYFKGALCNSAVNVLKRFLAILFWFWYFYRVEYAERFEIDPWNHVPK